MPRIEVKGTIHSRRDKPISQMEPMLKYDEGTVERIDIEGNKYIAIVISKDYTPERWKSFGLKTRKI